MGTILLLDDYYCFDANPNMGERKALKDFERNNDLKFEKSGSKRPHFSKLMMMWKIEVIIEVFGTFQLAIFKIKFWSNRTENWIVTEKRDSYQ